MIDNLIISYQAQIYNQRFQQNKFIVKIIYVILSLLCLTIVINTWSFSKKITIFTFVPSFVAISFTYCLNQYLVKHNLDFLQSRKRGLDDTKKFLKNVIPGIDLYQKDMIDELINRISGYIDQITPFKYYLDNIKSFTKTIMVPIISYIAGMHSNEIKNLSIDFIVKGGFRIIFLYIILKLIWDIFSDAVTILYCKNYNAAIAFREDLLDLRFLYFHD